MRTSIRLPDQRSGWHPQGVHVLPDRVVTTAYLRLPDGSNGGSRLTVLDRATGRWSDHLLTDRDGGPLRIHAGGVAMHEGRLVVAATRRGLAVLDPETYALEGWTKPAGDLRYSFCATTPRGGLVVGEYDRDRPGRLWCDGRRWQGVPRMQGAVLDGRTWWISASRGRWRRGWLLGPRSQRLPAGPEDLAWDPEGGRVWTVTEYAWRRRVVSVPLVR